MIFFTLNFRLACLAFIVLQNVNKDYVIFSNFVAKTDEEQKNEKWNETNTCLIFLSSCQKWVEKFKCLHTYFLLIWILIDFLKTDGASNLILFSDKDPKPESKKVQS